MVKTEEDWMDCNLVNLNVKKQQNLLVNNILLFHFLLAKQWPENGLNDIKRVFAKISRGKWIRISDIQNVHSLALIIVEFHS